MLVRAVASEEPKPPTCFHPALMREGGKSALIRIIDTTQFSWPRFFPTGDFNMQNRWKKVSFALSAMIVRSAGHRLGDEPSAEPAQNDALAQDARVPGRTPTVNQRNLSEAGSAFERVSQRSREPFDQVSSASARAQMQMRRRASAGFPHDLVRWSRRPRRRNGHGQRRHRSPRWLHPDQQSRRRRCR